MSITVVQFIAHFLCAFTSENCTPYNPSVTPELPNIVGRNIRNSEVLSSTIPNQPIVFTANGGGVEGYVMKTISSRRIAAFEGIPFGKPPVGPLRFRVICYL